MRSGCVAGGLLGAEVGEVLAVGVCVPAPAAGEPCYKGRLCGGTRWCDPNTLCQPQKPPGEPCTTALECTLFKCTNSVCTDTPWICTDAWSAS